VAPARGDLVELAATRGISFPDRYPEALPTLAEMVRTLAPHERIDINVHDEEVEAIARKGHP